MPAGFRHQFLKDSRSATDRFKPRDYLFCSPNCLTSKFLFTATSTVFSTSQGSAFFRRVGGPFANKELHGAAAYDMLVCILAAGYYELGTLVPKNADAARIDSRLIYPSGDHERAARVQYRARFRCM
jgi:hypothetical protein